MIYRSKEKSGNTAEEPLLLWTNPNRSTGRNGINLTFNNIDTSKYKCLIISSINYTGDSSNKEQITNIAYFGQSTSDIGYKTCSRHIGVETTSNSITVVIGSDTTNNGQNFVPIRIWALTENTKLPVI